MATVRVELEKSTSRTRPVAVEAVASRRALFLFALAGLAFLVAQPSVGITAATALVISIMAGAAVVTAVRSGTDERIFASMRQTVELLAPALSASLLWLAIGLAGPVTMGTSAIGLAKSATCFVLLVSLEAVLSAALLTIIDRGQGRLTGVSVAVMISARFQGLAGTLR